MKKSFVTAVATVGFVVYSLYQRSVGVQGTADAAPGPSIGNTAANASQGSSGNAAPSSAPSPTANPPQSDPSPALPTDTPTSVPQPTPTPTPQSGSQYKNGTYTGATASAFYGNVQVQATIANGQLTDVRFVQWPNDRARSVMINQQALPMLVQEAIQAQSANVDIISGATDSSDAFAQSLQSALGKAQPASGARG